MSNSSRGLILSFIVVALCLRADAVPSLAPGNYTFTVKIGALERDYLVHVPPGASSNRALPLLIALHGGGGNAPGMQRAYGIDTVADREGFVAVYPQGSGRLRHRFLTWNAGACCGYARQRGIDDVTFVRRVVDDLAVLTPIDRSRVYATGHSNGGMLAHRLAREASDLIAAIGVVAGASLDTRAAPVHAVPVLHIHSVDDPRAVWAGGRGPRDDEDVNHANVDELVAWWVKRNGCRPRPTTGPITRWSPNRGVAHTAQRFIWSGGRNGSRVELLKLTGAGHGWPGGTPILSERAMGPNTSVVDATAEIWRFVSRFRRTDSDAA